MSWTSGGTKNMDGTLNIRMYARWPFNPNGVSIFTSEINVTKIFNMSTLVKLDMLFRMALEIIRSDHGKCMKCKLNSVRKVLFWVFG